MHRTSYVESNQGAVKLPYQYQYLHIPAERLLPFARLIFGHNFVCHDDNARPHRAHTVANFMEAEGIEHMIFNCDSCA